MLFNSYAFIFLFAPVVLAGFYFLQSRAGTASSYLWLLLASLAFYAWDQPHYLLLLLGSITGNFVMGRAIENAKQDSPEWVSSALLAIGVAGNLALLSYYKYANFFAENIGGLLARDFSFSDVVLPLGISFHTFQQIAYIVDRHRCSERSPSFMHYALFIAFFPQLIAGPIVHHSEFLPQLRQQPARDKILRNLATGLTVFMFGLAKKTVIADTVAQWASPVYAAAGRGETLTLLDGWFGAIAYSLQIYFDFSAYSDMAIGLGLMFGFFLPANFNSPYKAFSIIEFWRRWHITLSRFLRDYLYIPLGGSRGGSPRRYLNLLITMTLAGLWHGAAWTFVVWGAFHGLLLATNHVWRHFAPSQCQRLFSGSYGFAAGRMLTFLVVTISWIFFRSDDMASSLGMLRAVFGLNGLTLPISYGPILGHLGIHAEEWGIQLAVMPYFHGALGLIILCGLLAIVWCLPNTQEIVLGMQAIGQPVYPREGSAARRLLVWRPTSGWGIAMGAMTASALLGLSQVSEFIYFRF